MSGTRSISLAGCAVALALASGGAPATAQPTPSASPSPSVPPTPPVTPSPGATPAYNFIYKPPVAANAAPPAAGENPAAFPLTAGGGLGLLASAFAALALSRSLQAAPPAARRVWLGA